MSNTHDCGGDAAAYVLGALDDTEVEAFTAHMAECIVCRDEVTALRSVSDALAMAAPQYPAPNHLRRQVMRQVRKEQRAQSATATQRAPRLAWPALRPAVVAGFAAVLAAVVLGAVLLSSGGSGATNVFRASIGQAEVRLAGGHGQLIVNRLKTTQRGHVYEVWLQRDGHPPSPTKLLFNVDASGRSTVGLPDLHGVDAILVTSEPAGGSQAPTSAPVIVTPLTKRA